MKNGTFLRNFKVRTISLILVGIVSLTSCYREPPLHLYDWGLQFPMVELRLDIYWNYENNLGIDYDWRSEWYYGWDEEDKRIFGELEYVVPNRFFLRRYYTGDVPYGSRIYKREAYVIGKVFRSEYDWGYWDFLAWNDVETIDGVQSLHFQEPDSIDKPVIAFTNQTMYPVRYHAPKFLHSFWQPEQLVSACEEGVEINKDLRGFEFDPVENIWIKTLRMMLEPITYIYLPQIILHHNNGNVVSVPSSSNLSGMARSTNVNTGVAGTDAIAVSFNMRLKNDIEWKTGEMVDIIGGRLMTFGICGQNANRISRAEESFDKERHYRPGAQTL